MDEKRVSDYFVVTGLPENNRQPFDDYPNCRDGSSSPPALLNSSPLDPITDITVIIRSAGETVPPSWYCIETTPLGFPADLNHGSIRSPNIFLCYQRGRHKPPLVDIGVLYEGKERVLADSDIVHTTLLGRSANVNNGSSRIFLTYRRAKENAPCNQLVVTDICVILMNKGETPPHAYCLVNKNLNKGMMRSIASDVYICYKKSMDRPPLLRYQPCILGRFPVENYPGYELPDSVPLFCMPMGAAIECWPKKSQQPRSIFSTFVLTSDTAVKVYGAAITFYEIFDPLKLNSHEKQNLEYDSPETKQLYAMKSLCILSRWPFFDTFEKFLHFLYKTSLQSQVEPLHIPLEQLISHFMMEIPFPSSQRPNVAYQLTSNEELKLSQPPEDMPLPLSGASFSQMLRNLGPENCLNILVIALAEQKILLHSLRPDVLTSVAESITSIIFPLVWQCPYIPLCPLGLCDVLNAPLPFIIGVDSRYFDSFVPPVDVVCVDLDTSSIYLSEQKKILNSKLLPKKATRVLRTSLERLYEKLYTNSSKPNSIINGNNIYSSGQPTGKPSNHSSEQQKKFERQMDLEIQEAFLRFMSSILKGFRSFLRPIKEAPTAGATDPGSLFDLKGFINSRDRATMTLYHIIIRTQMFARFIEERSFVSDKDSCLAFFDECLDKIEKIPGFENSNNAKLIDVDDWIKSDRTVFIPAPEPIGNGETYVYKTIDGLNPDLFHAVPVMNHRASCLSWQNLEAISPTRSARLSLKPSSPLSRRTKQEIRLAQRIAKRHKESPLSWAKYLVSYVYSLWFVQLPAYIRKLESSQSNAPSKATSLRLALPILSRLQSLNLHPVDETCYRVLMLLCGEYHQPVLATKVLFEMTQNGVTPNAITYGYYNKAVLESPWPSNSGLWSKLRNVIVGVSAFKKSTKNRTGCRKTLTFNEIEECEESELTGNAFNESTDKVSSGSLSDVDVRREEKLFFDEKSKTNGKTGENINETQYSIDFSHSNNFRKRTGRVVRASTVALPFALDYCSPAGLLMSSSYNDDVFLSPTKVPLKKRGRQRISSESNGYYETSPTEALRKEFLRSYSFGNDSRIIQNLKEGPLKALKHELERNHQILPENELTPDPKKYEINKENFSDQITTDEIKVQQVQNDTPPSSKGSSKQNLSSVSGSLRKFSAHAIKTYRSSSVDGWLKDRSKNATGSTGSMSPIKDAMSNLFSPEGKLLTLANRLATKLSETSAKDIIGRSLGESLENQQNSSSSRDNMLRVGNMSTQNRPESGMSRSATLPPDVEGRVALDCSNDNHSHHKSNSQESIENDQIDQLNQSTQSTSEKYKISSSPWARSLQGKHVDYFKSAASSMANRISEIRTNLSVNSPAKLSTSGGSFFSQWASIVEKIPTNFGNLDDDSSSINSSEKRFSEDDISENGPRVPRLSSAINSLLETIESHYNQRLGDALLDEVIIIEMTSCCRCYECKAFAFDEEIMANWTADESNLNTQCEYCQSTFVPLLTIEVKPALLGGQVTNKTNHQEELLKTDKSKSTEPFTVPYLSPLVLRKEVENVLEHESDSCLLSPEFITDHPIIYWNLIWYFERVNLPSHLPGLVLQCDSILPQVTILPEHDHRNVKVVCRYDNERLHQDSSFVRPLYRRWLDLTHPESSLLDALVTDKRQVSEKVLKQLLSYIEADDFKSALHLLLTEKLKINCFKTPYNPYRELLFLSFVAFGREHIDQVNFHFMYKRAYESIIHIGLSHCDQPPSYGAIFCRRFFKQLELQTLVKQPISSTYVPTDSKGDV